MKGRYEVLRGGRGRGEIPTALRLEHTPAEVTGRTDSINLLRGQRVLGSLRGLFDGGDGWRRRGH